MRPGWGKYNIPCDSVTLLLTFTVAVTDDANSFWKCPSPLRKRYQLLSQEVAPESAPLFRRTYHKFRLIQIQSFANGSHLLTNSKGGTLLTVKEDLLILLILLWRKLLQPYNVDTLLCWTSHNCRRLRGRWTFTGAQRMRFYVSAS